MQRWSDEWSEPRRVMVRFRRGPGFEVRPEFEPFDGTETRVHRPRVMDQPEDGGHSLYAGQLCWDIVDMTEHSPGYICEGDFIWIDPRPEVDLEELAP